MFHFIYKWTLAIYLFDIVGKEIISTLRYTICTKRAVIDIYNP